MLAVSAAEQERPSASCTDILTPSVGVTAASVGGTAVAATYTVDVPSSTRR
jgi:hypothetical protein